MKMQLQPWTNTIVIDLGSANVSVFIPETQKLLRYPAYLVRHQDSRQIIAVGEQAQQLEGKTAQSLEVVTPIQFGVVADSESTVVLIEWIFQQIRQLTHTPNWLFFPKIVLIAPNTFSPVQRKTLKKIGQQLSLRPVSIVSRGVAQLSAEGMPANDASGKLVIDFGSTQTEVSVVGANKIFYSLRMPLGGKDLTRAIQRYLKRQHQLDVGFTAAEQLKISLANIKKERPSKKNGAVDKSTVVRGRSIASGLPETVVVTQSELDTPIGEIIEQLQDKITEVLDEVSADLAADVVMQGVYLAGGGANLPGLKDYLSSYFGTQVFVDKQPELSAVRGAIKVVGIK